MYDLSAGVAAHARSANAPEKDARAALYGATKRALSDRDIVILDGLNYIKGWRYQLFCEAKAVRTPSCILQIGCTKERSKEVNEARLAAARERRAADGNDATGKEEKERGGKGEGEEAPYEPGNWENLVFRYEEPNPMTRWDSPLFTLIWEDDEERARAVFADIWDAVAGEGKLRGGRRPDSLWR